MTESWLHIGDAKLDVESGRLDGPGEQVRLEPRVAEVARVLAHSGGELLSRDDLIESVWRGRPGADAALTASISKLRRALDASGADARVIETIPKRGYRLRADSSGNVAAPGTPAVRIAVLPFRMLALDPAEEYLGEAVAEDLHHALAGLSGVAIAPRTSTFALAHRDEPLSEFARQLSAVLALEGTVRRLGSRIEVRVRLCTTEPAEQLWSREFELAEQDLEGWAAILLDAIGPELRGRYGVDVSQVNIPAESVHSPEAYRTFLIGRYFWYRENSNPGRALELYRKAVSLAPRFAAPYAGLVDCYCTYGLWQMMPQAEARRRALRSAEQAISLAPDNPDSQFSHGYAQFYARWHWAEAEAVFRHLLRRQPEYISGNSFLGLLLAALGRDDEAEALGERLVALDPASPWCWFIRGQCAWFRRDFECQAESGLQGLTLSANDPLLLYVAAKGLALSGEFQQANALTEQLERIAGQVDIFLAIAATTRGHCGEMDRARAQCTELENRAKQHPVSPMLFGLVYAILGRRDEALDALEAAYRERNMMLWIIACDPVFDELRGERRFRDLVQAMDLPDASPAG